MIDFKEVKNLKKEDFVKLEENNNEDEIPDELDNTDDIPGSVSSPEDTIIDYKKVTVKFLLPDSETFAQVYPDCFTIGEIRSDLARKFEVDPNHLIISQFKYDLIDKCKLKTTCKNDYGIIELNLRLLENMKETTSTIATRTTLDLQVYYEKSRLADFITVHISSDEAQDDQRSRDIVVEIQNRTINKPFLGGYQNLKTGVKYFDAFTQTGPAMEAIKSDGITSRDTQTAAIRSKSIDTFKESSTQAFGDATKLVHLNSVHDYIIIPTKYETAFQKEAREKKLAKIILIQKNFRRYLLQRYITQAAAEYRRLVKEEKELNSGKEGEKIIKFQRECVFRAFPKTREDFEFLLAQVQKWKESELKRISEMYSGAAKIAEMHALLDREIQLLNGIETQRSLVSKAIKEYRDEKILLKLAEPVKWVGYRDMLVEMDLLRTQRARKLGEFYKQLQKEDYKPEERFELIEKIANYLHETEEPANIAPLMELFNREKILVITAKHCDMSVLRVRQLKLFYNLIQNDKTRPKPKDKPTRICEICKLVKPIKAFALRTRQNVMDTCKKCYYLSQTVSDNTIYISILRSIQRDERRRNSLSSYAFIMQEDDIKFLVEKIWHGHSVLSKCDDKGKLRLPRCFLSEEWAPWNCICLTEAEARCHINIENLSDLYNEEFITSVKNRNLAAKMCFKTLQKVDENFVESGEWYDVGIKERVV